MNRHSCECGWHMSIQCLLMCDIHVRADDTCLFLCIMNVYLWDHEYLFIFIMNIYNVYWSVSMSIDVWHSCACGWHMSIHVSIPVYNECLFMRSWISIHVYNECLQCELMCVNVYWCVSMSIDVWHACVIRTHTFTFMCGSNSQII